MKEAIAGELRIPNPRRAARKNSTVNPPKEEFEPLLAYGQEIGTVSPFTPNALVQGWYYVVPELDPSSPVEIPFGFKKSLIVPRDAFENLMFYTATWHRGERMRIVRDTERVLYCSGLPFPARPITDL